MNRFAQQIADGNYSTNWVCVDCMLMHANGECGEDPDREPLNLIPDTADVSLGLLAEHHADGCDELDRSEDRCECETTSFSSSACDGCGSQLAGERHALTVVYDMDTEVSA